MVPLTNASQLGEYIAGSAVETIEMERIISEYEHVILDDVYGQGKPLEEVMQTIQQDMGEKNVQIKTLNVTDIYEPSEAANNNVIIWRGAATLGVAKGRTKRVCGCAASPRDI